MGKYLYRVTVTILSVLWLLSCLLPIISVDSGGLESCTLYVRGYNLLEFSALGSITLLSPIAVLLIIAGYQHKSTKELVLIVLMFSNIISYIHSFHIAHRWFESVGDSNVAYHSGMLIIPILSIITVIFSICCDKGNLSFTN